MVASGLTGTVPTKRWVNEANRTKCELQYDSDLFQCSLAASARSRQACREQAQSRFTLCMKDQPVPDLIYYLG